MRALLLCMLVACGSRHEGDVPLRVTNPPCSRGAYRPAVQVVMRLENGGDSVQQAIGSDMIAANTWAGRTGTLKLGSCPLNDPCVHPFWLYTSEVTVRGDDHGLELDLPDDFDVRCKYVGPQ